MTLLELKQVSKRYQRGKLELEALREVSFELDRSELVAVWGRRYSGRTTLLRIAAGIEVPDSGEVRFAGLNLSGNRADALAEGIAYCQPMLRIARGRVVLDEVITAALARGETPSAASRHALAALERADAQDCAGREPRELHGAEHMRASIARALAARPSLLLVDEPTKGVDLLERDGILSLLRSLTQDGLAVLTTVGESAGLFEADRALSLRNGHMNGSVQPEIAPVFRLPQPASA